MFKTEAIPVNSDLLGHSPQEVPSSAADSRDHNETGAQLLELRTGAGVVYVCPSRWQRIRLQWAFRHFHQLPLQVLSRRDQRLIEKLMRSSPASPAAGTNVLGVVENVHPKPPASAARVVTMRPQLTPQKPFRAAPWTPTLLSPDFSQRKNEREMKQVFGTAKSREVRSVVFRQWGALAALSAVCAALIVASLYGVLPSPTTKPAPHAPAAGQTLASNHVKPPAAITPAYVSAATLLPTLKLKHAWAPPTGPAQAHNELASLENELNPRASVPSAKTIPPAVTPASNTEPLLVSELPQGHFAHPVVSEPNLVGELQLKALIGADGLVKRVTVLSGNPKLAAAGMRAVRQWRYAPYEVLGNPVEVETHIKMSFFGEDAVSVASVSTGPPTGPRLASVPSVHDQPLSPKAND
jgi:TonB-like protein